MEISPGKEMPWWELYPEVYRQECDEIRKAHFEARIEPSGDNPSVQPGPERLIVSGRIRLKAAKPGEAEGWHGMTIDIVYPDQFPFDKPKIIPVDPQIRRTRHQTRKNGEICYMQEEMESWSLGSGIERAIAGAKDWFRGYLTGKFDNEVPAAELLFYMEGRSKQIRALLLPEHDFIPLATYGTFELVWDTNKGGLGIFTMHEKFEGRVPEASRETNGLIWQSLRRDQTSIGLLGLWIHLQTEPHPFSTLAELEEVLLQHGGFESHVFRIVLGRLITPQVRKRGWFPLGISYPGRDSAGGGVGNREWFFMGLEWPACPAKQKKIKVLKPEFWEHVNLVGIPSYPVGREALVRRVGELYPANALKDAHVVVVGAGALGSTVAKSLAAAGLGRVTLVDDDIVKPGNVVRHEARMPDIGISKVGVLAQILKETNPYIEVDVISGTRGEGTKFRQCILSQEKRPDLVVVAVAIQPVDGQVDELARRAEQPMPVLHAWVMAQAQVLRTFVHWPGETACVWCCGFHHRDALEGKGNGYIIDPDYKVAPFFEDSCASPAYPGSGNANALSAHVVVEMALDVLHGRLRKEESHWVFAGNRIHDLAPTYSVPPFGILRRGFDPHPDCPVCAVGLTSQQFIEKGYETITPEMDPQEEPRVGWGSRILRACLRGPIRDRAHAP